MKAIWNETIIAQSDNTQIVENNHYFPVESLQAQFFDLSDESSTCPWKGVASYYDVVVDGNVNRGAAWYYQTPSDAAANIKNHVAFWKGVEITE